MVLPATSRISTLPSAMACALLAAGVARIRPPSLRVVRLDHGVDQADPQRLVGGEALAAY